MIHTFNPDDNWGTLGYAFIYDDDVAEEYFEDGYGKNNILFNPNYVYRETEYYVNNTVRTAGTENFFIGDIQVDASIMIMVHELIHLLGVGLGSKWYNNLLFSQGSYLTTYFPSNLTPNYLPRFSNHSTGNVVAWKGENAIREYKKILTDFGYDTRDITYLPIENSGTSSQALQHPEEGRYIYNGLKYAEYILSLIHI